MEEIVLEIENLEKIYPGGVHAVRGISFNVKKGESVAIIGSSGSGKSTVLRCINRLIEPTKGTIKLNDQIVNNPLADVNEIRSKIGMVFQSFELFSHLTVLDNITLGLRHVRGLKREEAEENALKVLERVDMLDRIEAFPGNLSGGQKQRVAIARALISDTDLILADEPTGNLDSKTSYDIMDLFAQLHDKGNTIIMVTHEDDIAQYAHRVVRMRDGLVETDTINENPSRGNPMKEAAEAAAKAEAAEA